MTGVIDPARGVRTALQDAASVASILIAPSAAVADAPKKGSGGGSGGMAFQAKGRRLRRPDALAQAGVQSSVTG